MLSSNGHPAGYPSACVASARIPSHAYAYKYVLVASHAYAYAYVHVHACAMRICAAGPMRAPVLHLPIALSEMCDMRCAIFRPCAMCDVPCAMRDVRYALYDVPCAMCHVRCAIFRPCAMYDVGQAIDDAYALCAVPCAMCHVRYAGHIPCAMFDVGQAMLDGRRALCARMHCALCTVCACAPVSRVGAGAWDSVCACMHMGMHIGMRVTYADDCVNRGSHNSSTRPGARARAGAAPGPRLLSATRARPVRRKRRARRIPLRCIST